MSTIQILAGDWGRQTRAVLRKCAGQRLLCLRTPLGTHEEIDLKYDLARAEEIHDRQPLIRLGWSIDLVRRVPLRLTRPQGLVWFTAHLRDGRRFLGATDRETFAHIQGAASAEEGAWEAEVAASGGEEYGFRC